MLITCFLVTSHQNATDTVNFVTSCQRSLAWSTWICSLGGGSHPLSPPSLIKCLSICFIFSRSTAVDRLSISYLTWSTNFTCLTTVYSVVVNTKNIQHILTTTKNCYSKKDNYQYITIMQQLIHQSLSILFLYSIAYS